jgi:mRNA interferase RelE/StbE
MAYRIELTRSVTKELSRLSNKLHDRVVSQLRSFESEPRPANAEKLTGIDAYKFRVGDLRIIYQIDDKAKTVRIVMVDDRKQVYKRLKRK